ncbi:MAG: M28 family peptidase [Patescibacteria group bacterium]
MILTTHYNTFLSSPGANDNASGVAVLLKINSIFC